MSTQELIEQLLALPDADAQKRFLEAHASQLDDSLANGLKQQADQFLRSDVQRSLQTASLLVHAGQLVGEPCYRALGLLAEANCRCLGGLGEYQRSLALYDQAASIYQSAGRLVEQAISQIGKLYALAFLGRYREALETGEWVSRVLQEHGQWRRLAAVTLNLGLIHGRMGEDEKALHLFDRTKELYRQLGEEGKALLPWADHNRAIVLRNLGHYEASLAASQQTWDALSQLGQTVEAARARQNLALTCFVLGRYNEALDHLDRVREVFLADGRPRDTILVDLFVTDCLLQLRRFPEVLDRCEDIREHFADLGARFEVAQVLLNEAMAYAGLRRHDEAKESLAEARRLFAEEGNQVAIACTDLEQAALLLQEGQFQECLAVVQASTDVFAYHNLPVRVAQAELIAAWTLTALQRHDEARDLAQKALGVAANRDIPSLMHQGHHLLGTLAVAQGDPQKALEEYDQAIQELERLRGRLMIEFRVDFLADKQAVYEDAICLCLDLDRTVVALEYAERAKSRALLDLLAYRLDLSPQIRGEADRPLVEELVRLRAERDRLYRRWEGREEVLEQGWTAEDASRHQAGREVLVLEKRITELWHRLLVRNADYARDAALWQVRTEPIQPYLAPGTMLLEYTVAHDQTIAFVATGDMVRAWRLHAHLPEVQRLIQLFWLNLRAVPGSTPRHTASLAENARGLLQRLYDLLIAPLAETLVSCPRLIVVPHGSLHYLPFHALYDGHSFLLERHEIGYLPGASLLRYSQEVRPAGSGLLAFGHSCGGRLPHAVEEAEAIARLLGGRAFSEGEATLACLREAAPDCQAIHVASHGEFRPDNPLFSGLALADGWLTTLDIFHLRLRASLVVLSACQTGQNVIGGGDELLGLMRALLCAGAKSVVLSLWAVEDRSTAQLMEVFYQRLAQGWSKGAALRHAQRSLLAGDDDGHGVAAGRYVHPYFWAPFCLVGDSGPLQDTAW